MYSESGQGYEKGMKELSGLTFTPVKGDYCKNHKYQERDYICGKEGCEQFLNLFCSDCSHPQSHLLQFKRGTTVLKAFLQQKWARIQDSNHELSALYTTCNTNIRYCQDILGQIEQEVQKYREESNRLPIFQEILDSLIDINKNGKDNEGVGERLAKLSLKHKLFQKLEEGQKQKIKSEVIDREIDNRQRKWTKIGDQIKSFSEKMLAFIDQLRLQFQSKKYAAEKDHKANEKFINRLAQLSQLMSQLKTNKSESVEQKMENLPSLIIELPEKTQSMSKSKTEFRLEECQFLEDNLHKFRNLTSMVIKNKNGRIDGKMWGILTSKMEFLKFLKELWLNIRVEDMKLLTKLFKERPNAVRSISILHLTITDEPKLDMKEVAQFCNTLELRELYLVLSRDNIKKANFMEFVKVLRFRTSLSNLPMDVLDANLSKNKIVDEVDIRQCTTAFNDRFGAVKKTKILF